MYLLWTWLCLVSACFCVVTNTGDCMMTCICAQLFGSELFGVLLLLGIASIVFFHCVNANHHLMSALPVSSFLPYFMYTVLLIDVMLPDNTMAFVSAKMSIPAVVPWDPILLKGISIVAVPGDPRLDDYEHSVPDFPYPMAVGLGQEMSFKVTGSSSTGGLQVDLESIALNVGVAESKSSVGASVSPISKKCKFMAVAPKGGDHVGTLSEVGRGDEGPSASPVASSTNDPCELASSMTVTHQSPCSTSGSVTPTDDSLLKSAAPMSVMKGRGKEKWA
ncbi:hypothetical protein EDC04DRAFT_3091056 [Pisolithus marmoratus]|nr:hypothetical protein EDC04DRAFT_3091056 [Pisolithus marmoratus]